MVVGRILLGSGVTFISAEWSFYGHVLNLWDPSLF